MPSWQLSKHSSQDSPARGLGRRKGGDSRRTTTGLFGSCGEDLARVGRRTGASDLDRSGGPELHSACGSLPKATKESNRQSPIATAILAVDLGKYKCVARLYDSQDGSARFLTFDIIRLTAWTARAAEDELDKPRDEV